MCGIAAVFAYQSGSPNPTREELLNIRDSMIERGPDDAGIWCSPDGCVGLAHRRLAIIDLSPSGAQPMATAEDTSRIVFNGEIYNYRQLRQSLEAKGYQFQSNSDTEVLLRLYEERGEEMVHLLRGMYAFAIWDNVKKGLFVARDPFGIKPLYYSDDGSTLRLASQVKALLAGGQVETEPDPAGKVGFLLWGHVPEPFTMYKRIRVLPAGVRMWVAAGGKPKIFRFFDVSEELRNAEQTQLSLTEEHMREHLRVALLDSLRHHLVADVPVGLFLSAGLDSTTLAGLTREISDTPLKTITLGFMEYSDGIHNEVPLAEKVAQHYGTNHTTEWITKTAFDEEYPRLLAAMDQPSIDGVNTYFVSKAAAENGLKVALSGLGGDELFGGYPSFKQIPLITKRLAPLKVLPGLGTAFRYISADLLRRFTSSKYAGLLEYGTSYGGAYLLRRGLFMPWELPEVLDAAIVREGWAELSTLSRLDETVAGIRRDHFKICALETAWYMRNQLLRDADWASMAHSLEIRVPLVDVELFRIVARLFTSTTTPSKRAMAQTPRLALPQEILERTKSGFSVPVREWSSTPGSRHRGLRDWALRLSNRV